MEKAIILCSLSLGNEKNDDNFLWRLTHHFSTGAKQGLWQGFAVQRSTGP